MDVFIRLITLPISSLAIAVLVYLPGHYLTSLLPIRLHTLERFFVSVVVGIITLVYLFIIVGLFLPPFAVLVPLFLLGLKGWQKTTLPSLHRIKDFTRESFYWVLLYFFGIFAMGWFMFRGAVVTSKGVYVAGTSYHDALWHLSLISELQRQFPPQIPTIAGVALKNYHYFSDIVTSVISLVLPFDVRHLYFLHVPFFIIVMIGISVTTITRKMTSNRLAPYIAVFLTFFAGSFAYVLPFIFGLTFQWQESSFWVSQTVSMTMNPPFTFSIPIFFCIILLVAEYYQSKNTWLLVLVPPIVAALTGFKIYAFFIGAIGLTLFTAFEMVKERTKSLFVCMTYVASLLLSYLTLQVLKGPSSGSVFLFEPLWYMRALVEHTDRMPILDWVLREDTYRAEKNWLRVAQLRLYELIIFIVGNLGVRILGIFAAFRIFRAFVKNDVVVVLLLFCLIPSFVLPLLFVQNGSVASTIQFWYYTLLIMNIFAATVIANFLRNKRRVVVIVVLVSLELLAIPTTLQNIYSNRKGYIALDRNQYDSLLYLRKKAKRDAIILVPADIEQLDKAYVSAFSQRQTFLSYGQIAEITKIDVRERKEEANAFFDPKHAFDRKSFVRANKIGYIYDLNKAIDFRLFGFQPVYQNRSVQILATNSN